MEELTKTLQALREAAPGITEQLLREIQISNAISAFFCLAAIIGTLLIYNSAKPQLAKIEGQYNREGAQTMSTVATVLIVIAAFIRMTAAAMDAAAPGMVLLGKLL